MNEPNRFRLADTIALAPAWMAVSAIVATLLATAPARAQSSYTWNAGSGTWDTSALNWLDASGNPVAWPSAGTTNTGVFSASSNTVTIPGAVAANQLLFTTGGYVLQSTGTITFNGSTPTINVATGTATIGNATATKLAGSSGFTKSGTGTLQLNPSAASTITGGVAVNGGRLFLDYTNLAGTNMLPTSNTLSLANATLYQLNRLSTFSSSTFASTSVGAGLSYVITQANTSGTSRVDVGTLSRSAQGGVVALMASDGTVPASSTKQVRSGTVGPISGAAGYIAPWAVMGDPTSGNARWAYAASSGVTGTAAGWITTVSASWANVTSATTAYGYSTSGTLAASASAYTLLDATNGSFTINLGGNTLTTNGLGKAVSGGGGVDTYTSGTIAVGSYTSSAGTSRELVMIGSGSFAIQVPIVDNAGGASAVTYAGGGLLTLSGSSTFTGPLTVNAGRVQFNAGGSVNSASGVNVYGGRLIQTNTSTALTPTVTLNSGTVDGTGTINTVNVANNSAATLQNGNGATTALTVGNLTFNGSSTVNVASAGSAGITVTNTLTTTPANGTVTLNVTQGPTWVSGSAYNLVGFGSWSGDATDFTLGTVVGLGGHSSGALGKSASTNGFLTMTVSSVTGTWTGQTNNLWTTASNPVNWDFAGTPDPYYAGDVVLFDDTATNVTSGTATVDISGSNAAPASLTFNNSTVNYAITSGSSFGIAGSTGLTKNGTGQVVLQTANSYSGVTTINAGTLATANTTNALPDAGLVTFGTSASATLEIGSNETIGTLAGGAGVSQAVVLANGARLSTSSGTQTFAGAVTGTGTLVNNGALQTYNGPISGSVGVQSTGGRLFLGASNSYTGTTAVTASGIVIVRADSGLGAGGVGSETVFNTNVTGAVVGFENVNYTVAETIIGQGVGTGAAGYLLGTNRGFVQGASGTTTFAGNIVIGGTALSRIGTQDGASLVLTGPITSSTTGVSLLFRPGNTNGDFVTLASTGNSWDCDTGIYTGNNTAGQYAGVRLGVSNALPSAVSVCGVAGGGVGTTLDLNGYNQALSGLTSGTQASGGVSQLRISNLAASSTSTLTLNVSADQSTSLTTLQEVAGGGVLALVKTGAGLQTLSGSSNYTGGTRIEAGTLVAGNAQAFGGSANPLTVNGGTVNSGAFNLAVGALAGTGGVITTATDAGTRSLTANVASGVSVFAGSIQDNGAGLMGLVKEGAGKLTLTGSNSYTGATTVNAGVFAVNGSLGATAVTVGSAGTLGGSGLIAGDVTVDGVLSPGNSPGELTVANLVLGGSSTSLFEINGLTRGTDYDGITLTGTLLVYDGALSMSFGTTFSSGTSTFDLFAFSGTPTGAFSSVLSTGAYAGTWTLDGSDWRLTSGDTLLTFGSSTGDLTVTVVPEPAAVVTIGIGLAAIAVRRFRRRGA